MAALRPPVINVIDKAVRRAGRGLVRDFGEVQELQVSRKGTADFVTAADLKAEKTLKEDLSKAHPDWTLHMEESGVSGPPDALTRWIVDPLDGTTNFIHGIPHFAISVAVEESGRITAGAVYHPLTDDFYWAAQGIGAYINDRRLRVSGRRRLDESVVATGIPNMGQGDHERYLATLQAVMGEVASVRRSGSAALDLAYVAAGRYEGFWEFGLKPWDIAAGLLLVREAGGFATAIDGATDPLPAGDVLAANDRMHQAIGRLLRRAMGLRAPRQMTA